MPDTRKQHNKTAPNSSGQEAALDAPWRDGITGLHFGALWIVVGLVSYLTLTLLARGALHSPLALQQLQQEVPAHVYDRSLFVFGTAFLLDVLGLLFELRSSRLDVVLLPAFVKGVATLTNSLMRSGAATVAFSTTGRAVMVQRFLCWMHTTPTILVLVKMMATNITRQQAIHAVVCVEVMVVTGLAGALTAGWWAAFWGIISHLAFLPLLPYLHQGLKEASAVVSLHAARPTMTLVYYLTMLMWTGFGLVWDLRVFDLISAHTEEVAYLCCDFSAKVMFSAGLMLSSFKGLDCRREVVMRQIQEAHKQTLILELKRAIEQKDAFMSSVSHELRTPLNGIIGISEGLLANCCGVLSESVRKQLFIVRTSGARLLALINDVMDAATLRQHRLVLKQERLELRQVVGDVVDLTRSLVGCDVSLRNDVPEGVEVWADSGRIIQILNNLLGNAAKFTHQGTIRVTARWHDEQRQWVAIHVIDTGIGIPKQKLQSIFLPFEQVDGSISRQYGGFGLGLCITQELVKAHGGELWVKSKEHKGSQFTFTIPSFTGQKPLTPQQQQQRQLQSRRSVSRSRTLGKLGPSDAAATAGGAGGSIPRCRSVSRGAALPLLAAPVAAPPAAAAAAAGGDDEGSNQPSGAAAAAKRRWGSLLLLPNGDDHPGAAPWEQEGGTPGPPADDLLESCVGDEYAKELPYDAAQLAALASSKPYTLTSPGGSNSSNSGSMQRIPSNGLHTASSMLSVSAGAAGVEESPVLDITPVPNRDQRPNQFACTGRYQVLSVDDDPVNQTVVRSLLASTGYEVVCLYNGQQTLEYIENADVLPDLILLDMLMPDMSGPDVCRQLAKRQPPLGVPIILVSALSEEASVVQGLDSGADDYITKPFRRAEFLARIRGKLQLTGAGAGRDQPSVQAPVSTGCEPVVMCITDDEVNHILLEGILQSQGYRYQKVSSGVEAIKLLAAAGNTPPHLVLLDAALPDMTGLDVLTTLRLQYSQIALPVIILTARHNEKAIVQALDAGANDYAVKPFRRAELLARIRMHLRSSQKAAAAVSPVAVHSAELSFAGDVDQQRMSVELLQRSLRLEQLSNVPLLVVQLDGVDEALASATAEETCQLMGFIADCFDALVEKYAVLKVDASDTCLTVAAPISISSCQNSACSSFQLPVLQLGSTPGNSTASLPAINHGPEATAAGVAAMQSPGDAQVGLLGSLSAPLSAHPLAGGAAAAAATHPADALTTALLQLQQMVQELHMWLGIDTPHSNAPSPSASSPTLSASSRAEGSTIPTGGPTAPSALQQQAASQQQSPFASDAGRLRARTQLQLLQPPGSHWWQGRVQPRTALHVGPLSAGVVGRRRPRYRLMGPALEVVRQACAQAPHGRTVATAAAAELLMASGVAGVRVLTRPGNRGTSWEGSSAGQKLWVVRTGEAAAMQSLMQLTDLSAAEEGTGGVTGAADGVLAQAAAALEGSAGIAVVDVPDLALGLPASSIPGSGPEQGSSSASLAPPAATSVAASTSLGLLLAPTTTAPPAAAQQQQQLPQQQQQHSLLCNGPLAAPGTEAPVPLLLDPYTVQSQQLLLQELSLFAQQLAGLNGTTLNGTTLPSSCNGSTHTGAVGLPGGVWGLQAPGSAGGSSVGPWLPPVQHLLNSTCAPAGSAALQRPAAAAAAAAPSAAAAAAVASSAAVDVMQAPWLLPPPQQAACNANCSNCPAPLAATQLLNGSSGWSQLGLSSLPDAVQPFAATTAGLSGAGSCPNDTAAASGGWQLGAAEVQQISLLHQELAALQLQLQTAMLTKGLSNGYGFPPQLPDGAAVLSAGPADTQQRMPDQHVQQQTLLQDQGQQQAPASSGAAQGLGGCAHVTVASPHTAAAAVARHDSVMANGVAAQDSISNSIKSDSGHCAGVAHQQQTAAPTVGSGRDRPRGQFLGQLFRRRSKKQKEQQGQQPSAKKA